MLEAVSMVRCRLQDGASEFFFLVFFFNLMWERISADDSRIAAEGYWSLVTAQRLIKV